MMRETIFKVSDKMMSCSKDQGTKFWTLLSDTKNNEQDLEIILVFGDTEVFRLAGQFATIHHGSGAESQRSGIVK